ncbi:hypothetical protein ACFL54_06540 [Planctomycetota bacterium]
MRKTIILFMLVFAMLAAGVVSADVRKERRKFYRSIMKKGKITFEDASKVLYMLKFDKFPDSDFAATSKELAEAGVPAADDLEKDGEINRGELSYMLVRALKIKGGLKMRLGIKNERYCYRELVFMKLMAAGNQRRKISGAELIGIFDKCSEYRSKKDGEKDN